MIKVVAAKVHLNDNYFIYVRSVTTVSSMKRKVRLINIMLR